METILLTLGARTASDQAHLRRPKGLSAPRQPPTPRRTGRKLPFVGLQSIAIGADVWCNVFDDWCATMKPLIQKEGLYVELVQFVEDVMNQVSSRLGPPVYVKGISREST